MNDNTCTELLQVFNSKLEEPFAGEIFEWASKHVDLKPPFEPTGLFDVSFSPYMIEPLKALKGNKYKQVNICKAVQTGGSLVMQLYLLWLICNKPGSTMLLHQPGDMSKQIMTNKLIPLIRSTQPVNDLIPNKRYAVKKDLIEFPHMSVIVSPATQNMLQSLTIQYLLLDEPWLYRQGDISQAKSRTIAHAHHRKIVLSAQAGDAGEEWDTEFHNAKSINNFGFKCPKCGTSQAYKWTFKRDDGTYAGMVWDKNDITCPEGHWHYEEAGKTARIECVNSKCKAKFYDTEENRNLLNNCWTYIETINQKGDSESISFHWPAWAMKNQKYGKIVEKYLQAKDAKVLGDSTHIRDFWLKTLAEFYRPEQIADNLKILTEEYDSSEKYGDYTFMTVDCQQDLVTLYYVVRAWSKNGESRQLERGCVNSFIDIENVQKKFGIPPHRVTVDSGYHTTTIYKECIKHGGNFTSGGKKVFLCWNSFKGFDKWTFPHKDNVKRLYSERANGDPIDKTYEGKYAPLYLWANTPYKDMLKVLRMGRGPKWVTNNTDADYERQLNSEVEVTEIDKKSGKLRRRWKVKPNEPNHYLDCELMQLVMATMVGCYGIDSFQVDNNNIVETENNNTD